MSPSEIGSIIYKVRKKSKLSQLQLAELAGIGKTAIFDLEKGKATIKLNTLLAILHVLNIKLKLETPLPVTSEVTE
jgi:y4mF family transcriptional regulator